MDRDTSPPLVTLGPGLLPAISGHRIGGRRTSFFCLFQGTADKRQGPLSNTHLKPPHSETALLCCPGTGPIFPSDTTGERWGQLSCSHNLRVWSSTYCRWQGAGRVERYLSLIHASGWKMSGKAISPMPIPSGSAHPQLPQLRPALLCFLSDMQAVLPSTATG